VPIIATNIHKHRQTDTRTHTQTDLVMGRHRNTTETIRTAKLKLNTQQ